VPLPLRRYHRYAASVMSFNLDLLKNIEFNSERDSQVLDAMRKIYPDASEEQLREGLENLKRYVKVGLKIAARVLREKSLTAGDGIPTMRAQRSNPTQTINDTFYQNL
jgi:hypothetical protein